MEITKDKVTELFCIIDEFYKVFDAENAGKLFLSEDVIKMFLRIIGLAIFTLGGNMATVCLGAQ